MEAELIQLEGRIAELKEKLKAKAAKEHAFAKKLSEQRKGYIRLNVGGVIYTTSKQTLAQYPESMLESLVSGRFAAEALEDGSIFIDRDGTHFGIILNALRTGDLIIPPGFHDFEALAKEIEFYQYILGPFSFPFLSFSFLSFCYLFSFLYISLNRN